MLLTLNIIQAHSLFFLILFDFPSKEYLSIESNCFEKEFTFNTIVCISLYLQWVQTFALLALDRMFVGWVPLSCRCPLHPTLRGLDHTYFSKEKASEQGDSLAVGEEKRNVIGSKVGLLIYLFYSFKTINK